MNIYIYGTIFRQIFFQVVEKHWITYHIELLEDIVGEDYSYPDRVADMATDAILAYLDKAIWGDEEEP